jgi:hypothetical protein
MKENKVQKESTILKALKADYTAAKQLREDWDGKIAEWKAWYNGEPYGTEKKNRSKVVSRDIKRQNEWQHPTLIDPFVSTSDIIKASPITFEDVDAARQNELVLNTQFCRQFNRYNFMTKTVKVLTQEGTAVVMTGWEYEEEEREVEVPIMAVNPMTGEPFQIGSRMEMQTIVTVNQPTAKVCRNEDVFIDPTCQDDMDKCQFVIYRYESDLSTLRQEGKYSEKRLKKVKINDEDGDYDKEDDTEFRFSDDPRKKVVVYEYWGNYDINDDGITEPIVCTWIGDTIIRLEDNPYPDKKPPFIVVPFSSVPFQLYGEANAEMIGDNQKIKTAIYRGIIDNMALSNNGQKGIRKGALDAVNRTRFFNGENFEFNQTPNDFWDGSYNNIPNSVFNVIQMQNNEIESLTGVKSFSGGITGASLGNTATGARGAMDATSTRRLDIVRNIAENLIKPLMRKWMAYNSEFLLEEQVIRITNDEFVPVRRDDLEGKIDIEISVATAEDNAAKAGELSFMLQTIGPNEDPRIRRTLMAEVARLQKMPDLAKKLEEYQPQPDPMAMKEMELRIALLEAQVQNERAKAMENQVDVQLKQAKTQSELAKAKVASSEADLKDLSFLERESGQDVRKDLAKKDHDAMTKIELERMKGRGGAR